MRKCTIHNPTGTTPSQTAQFAQFAHWWNVWVGRDCGAARGGRSFTIRTVHLQIFRIFFWNLVSLVKMNVGIEEIQHLVSDRFLHFMKQQRSKYWKFLSRLLSFIQNFTGIFWCVRGNVKKFILKKSQTTLKSSIFHHFEKLFRKLIVILGTCQSFYTNVETMISRSSINQSAYRVLQ